MSGINPQEESAMLFIKFSGGQPTRNSFDSEYGACGPRLREQMEAKGLIEQSDGRVRLVKRGGGLEKR